MLLVWGIYWGHCFQKFQKLENIIEENCKFAQKIEWLKSEPKLKQFAR